jgi:hypothetical protein
LRLPDLIYIDHFMDNILSLSDDDDSIHADAAQDIPHSGHRCPVHQIFIAQTQKAGRCQGCGFGNTAMQLAHQEMLPEVLAAVVRAMTAPRSLVAFERGAVGPSKDCAYEGPVLKAISGVPIAMWARVRWLRGLILAELADRRARPGGRLR